MKVALLADIHLSDRPPSSCTESYQDDLFDLLEQAREAALSSGVAAMVWAGDTFHVKAPSRVSHRLVHRVCDYIKDCPFPVLVLPGNHDMANDRLESVAETQPLGMLYRAGARELRGWIGFAGLYGVPWLPGYGAYTEESDNAVADALKAYRHHHERRAEISDTRETPYLVVAHAPLYPPGKELKYEYFPAERWAEAMGGRGSVFYGHVHEPHGTYRAGGVTFCNNGALSRGSLHEYNLTRKVGMTLWDDETGLFEFVELDAKPAEQVFRLQEKQQATDMHGRLDEFLEAAGSTTLEVMSAETVIEFIRARKLGREVEELAIELLEEVQHGQG